MTMNKREFLKTGLQFAATASLGLSLAPSAIAQSGQGYRLIDPPQTTRTKGKVEVLEYFWFGCPHCFAFEPSVNKWVANKPDYVEFIREAPPLNPAWEVHSRTFYAAELMGVTDQMFDEMFNAIHVERRRLREADKFAQFMGELGIDADMFRKTMDSFAVNTRMNQSMKMAAASGITGVPSVVINGKYLTGGSLAGSHEGILRVIDERAAEEQKLL